MIQLSGHKSKLFILKLLKKLFDGLVISLFPLTESQAPHQLKVDGITIWCFDFDNKYKSNARLSKFKQNSLS